MNKKLALALSLLISVLSLLYVMSKPVKVQAINGERVHNLNTGFNYTTIQAAIDASATKDGHTIVVDVGTYHEHVVVTKSLALIGEDRSNTVIDGSATGTVIHVTADNVTIKNFTVKNGNVGIYVDHSRDCVITEDNAIDNLKIDVQYSAGIIASYSDRCTISNNLAGNNAGRGIFVTNSVDFVVSNNVVYGSGMYGLNANSSINGLIVYNDVYANEFDGIGLEGSNNCIIAANNVSNNPLFGIYIVNSGNITVYHNNIVDNNVQAVIADATSIWDDGVEGNYWSDYNGNDTDYDGIGDSPYNMDNFPLMGMFRIFNTQYDYQVNVISNSLISNLNFGLVNSSYASLAFNVSGDNGTPGFCRVRIPKILINGSYTAKFDGVIITEPQFRELIPPSNENFEYLYINYTHSDHNIEIVGTTIIPELSSLIVLPLFTIATLLAAIIYRRKISKRKIL